MSKFKIGDEVAHPVKHIHDGDPGKLTILEIKGLYLRVKDEARAKNIYYQQHRKKDIEYQVKENEVVLYSEAKTQYDKLNDEFKALEGEIKDKLDIAASILEDVYKTTKDNKMAIGDFYKATSNLFSIMDNIGWRTSSFNC